MVRRLDSGGWILFSLLVAVLVSSTWAFRDAKVVNGTRVEAANFRAYFDSPVAPRVPNCKAIMNNRNRLYKTTKKKLFVATMFKNEEGYLAEFVAYYKIHGFDHIILWDHSSTDNFREELLPWTSTGFVEIRNTSDLALHPNILKARKLDNYWKVMAIKKQIEREAFLWGESLTCFAALLLAVSTDVAAQ